MVVCKFFLEGYCRFGPRCRFEHENPYNSYEDRSSDFTNERPSGSSVLRAENASFNSRQTSFQASPQASNPNVSYGHKYSVHEVMQIVSRDVVQAETGNQWQLSVYSPLRELPNLPGLEDHSPEELRWECYKAAQNNSVPIWQAIVQQMYANVAKANNDLKKKDTGLAIIDRWLRSDCTSSEVNTQAAGASQVTSAFGGAGSTIAGQSIFGGSQPNANVFNSSSAFGANSSSAFGTSNVSSSIFGGSSFSSPGVGTNNTSSSFFGGSNIMTTPGLGGNNASSSIFGGISSTTSPGFGGNNPNSSVFGGANVMTTPSGFSGNNTSTSIFGGSTITSTPGFGGSQTTPSVFGGNNMMVPNSGFAGDNTASSVFRVSPSNTSGNSPFFSQSPAQTSNSPFSSPQPASAQQNSVLGYQTTSPVIENHNFSAMEELSERELAAFKADKFTLPSIPTKPPPRALCAL